MSNRHAIAERTGPMTRRTLWIAFGMGLLALVWSTYSSLNSQDNTAVGFLGIPVWLFTPIITGIGSAILTGQAIAAAEITHSTTYYLFNALRRFRYLLVVAIILMPLWAVSQLGFYLRLPILTANCIGPCIWSHVRFPMPSYDLIVGRTMLSLSMALTLWGVNILIPTIATVLVLKSRRTGIAILAVSISVVVVPIGIFVLIPVLAPWWFPITAYPPAINWFSVILGEILMVLCPFLISFLLTRIPVRSRT